MSGRTPSATATALRLTVLVTSYNYRDYLVDAIDSVLAQTRPADQIVVVDDGSTDGSVELMRERYGADPRMRFVLKANGGQHSAFVAGLEAADGDVVAFLDADDVWEPDHLARLCDGYAHASQPTFVYTNLRFFGQREGLWHADTDDRDLGLSGLPTYALHHWEGSPTSALSMRIALARSLVPLPPDVIAVSPWRSRADDPLVYGAALLHGHKRYLGHPSVRYRAHGSNIWLGRDESPVQQVRYRYACDGLIAHYARLGGLSPASLMRVRREFETKPRPTPLDFRLYRRIAWKAPASFGKRLELVVGLWRYFLRTRRRR